MTDSDAHRAAFRAEAEHEERVYTVRDEGGYPTARDTDGVHTIPFWSKPARAQQVVAQVPAYHGFRVMAIDLSDWLHAWLPCLHRDGLHAGINWSGLRATGYDLTPEQVLTWFGADPAPALTAVEIAVA